MRFYIKKTEIQETLTTTQKTLATVKQRLENNLAKQYKNALMK